jgi:hypothetical protein
MRKKIVIINPTPARKIKKLKRRKKRVIKRRRLTRNISKSITQKRSAAVAKTTRRKTRKRRARKNPAGVCYLHKNRRPVRSRRRSTRRRLFKNPFDPMTGQRGTDLLVSAAGAGAGGIVTPWIGGVFQLQGMVRWAAQIGIALAGYYMLGKIGMRKAAVPFAAGGVAVTAFQFAQENGILAGLSGDNLTATDLMNMRAIESGMGNVMPQIGAVMPGIGAVMPQIGGAKMVETDDNAVYEEYTDSMY